ncbi:glycosyltransferase [Microterricola viridarii]|uniref:4,4'-diaponeurosporenoate glycosyltransferase n=1 Tax=Microterricola viridarii TaxID=412690 RepID=A0A1H1P9H7_9MICO|nr:glycosyltransferase [Microterricola viridarii]SDS07655.1 Glycosyltransferase involved in cell wall bisynthesis [Microterricola viridarii]
MTAHRGSIIIAAHNEQAVIGRTLQALEQFAAAADVEVFVVCNGCTDQTAAISRGFAFAHVIELDVASKTAALREGDRLAQTGPRIYLDADVVLSSRAARAVFDALAGETLAGRPPHHFDTSRASWPVRRWYWVRARLPSIAGALWGAGCYALSTNGRARFGEFPEIVSDDLFIDALFAREEIAIVSTDPVIVTTPRRTADLVRILQRSYRTQTEVARPGLAVSEGQRGQLNDLRRLLRQQPLRLVDVGVYLTIVSYSRLRAKTARGSAWERDSSSRETL